MMEAPAARSWFLRKHEDCSIFGPLASEQLARWASFAQVSPNDSVSTDQANWMKAPMLPELAMDWIVEVTSEQLYGPTTLGAMREFMQLGEIDAETFVINSCDATRKKVGTMAPMRRREKPPPRHPPECRSRSRIAFANWSARCAKSVAPSPKRRERYRELEMKFRELSR